MRSLAALFLVALGVLSCASPGPSVVFHGECCEVAVPEGWSLQMARAIAIAADPIIPQVAEMLAVPVVPGIRVELVRQRYLDDRDTYGMIVSGPPNRIVLGTACFEGSNHLEMGLAHELAHLHIRSSMWHRLPYLLNEGVAYHIADRFSASEPREAAHEKIDPEWLDRTLRLSFEEMNGLSDDERVHALLVGRDIVERIGLARLMTMVNDDRLSAADLLAASGNS